LSDYLNFQLVISN